MMDAEKIINELKNLVDNDKQTILRIDYGSDKPDIRDDGFSAEIENINVHTENDKNIISLTLQDF